MRKITTAITAAALAFSMLAAAVPAAAVTGYDSAYAGESAFVNISPGKRILPSSCEHRQPHGRFTGKQVDLAPVLRTRSPAR